MEKSDLQHETPVFTSFCLNGAIKKTHESTATLHLRLFIQNRNTNSRRKLFATRASGHSNCFVVTLSCKNVISHDAPFRLTGQFSINNSKEASQKKHEFIAFTPMSSRHCENLILLTLVTKQVAKYSYSRTLRHGCC